MSSRIKVKIVRESREKRATVEKTTMKSSQKTKGLRCTLQVTKNDRAVLSITVRDGYVARASRVPIGSMWQNDGSQK